MCQNVDLGKSQITEKIRVSTAALYRDSCHGSYWLVETWIFSDDPRQESHQIVHSTPLAIDESPSGWAIEQAVKVHKQITDNLRKRYGGWRGVFYRHMWE